MLSHSREYKCVLVALRNKDACRALLLARSWGEKASLSELRKVLLELLEEDEDKAKLSPQGLLEW